MTFALVFFSHSRTSDVVPITAVVGDANVGNDARVKWNGRTYKAKILFIGRKQICEIKLPLVTGDGELVEDIFDASVLSSPDFGTPRRRSVEYSSSNERETAIRLTAVEEGVALMKTLVLKMDSTLSSLMTRMERSEQLQLEILRRIPAKVSSSNIEYKYASSKCVSELRELSGESRNAFVLALEKEVYKDDTSELVLLVDTRSRTKDRVLFIKKCIFKYYDVPEHLQEDVWKKSKEALNSRVRRLRKTIRDDDASLSRTDLYRCRSPFSFHD